MKCYLRRLTYGVSFFLILLNFAFSGDLEELLREKLRERFGDSVKLENFRVYSTHVPSREEVSDVALKILRNVSRGSAELKLKNGKRLSVGLDVSWRRRVLVARRDVSVGERLSPDMFTVEERYLKSTTPDYEIDLEDILNYKATKPITKGEILRKSYLKKTPVIKRGDEVRVLYKRGNIEILLRAKALENGYVGSKVRLKLDNGKVIRGRVNADGSVVLN